jgi:type IV pilus assembly protein PilY1
MTTKPAARSVEAMISRTRTALAVMSAVVVLPVWAATNFTDISDVPLANVSGSSVTVLPNVYIILDNSGSMKRDFMPDGFSGTVGVAATEANSNNFYNSSCNTIWYNPDYTYPLPAKSNGTLYSDALWTSAAKNGYATSPTTVNLGTAPGVGSWGVTGSDLDTNRYVCTYNSGTPAVGTCAANASYTCTTQAQALANWTADQKKNFANWYAFYRTRIQMAKAAIGLAVKDIRGTPKSYSVDQTDADYLHANIGFNNIYDSTPVLSIAPFESGTGSQKASFYTNLYSQGGSSNTPTRTALISAGDMYADATTGPIKYACQRNYTVMMTDGYWNGTDPDIGNLDGAEPRPQWDGATSTTTVKSTVTKNDTYTWTTYTKTTSGCSGGRGKIKTTTHTRIDTTDTVTTTITVNGVTGAPSTVVNGTVTGADNPSSVTGACTTAAKPSDTTAMLANSTTTGPVVTTTSANSGGSSNTMADVAIKYYNTNLRPDLTVDDKGALKYYLPEAKSDANTKIDDVARWPHMTTYTIGLGVDGKCTYDADYKSADHLKTTYHSSFADIYNNYGTSDQANCKTDWPNPSADQPSAIDDLWHAAVNGRGTYFSAKDPKVLAASLKKVLADVSAAEGAGAAGGSSNLNPTPSKDSNYVGSYVTGVWTGDLAAYKVTATGGSDSVAAWSAATKLKARAYTDRTIYTSKTGGTSLISFISGNFSGPESAWFANSQLNQYKDEWTAAQITAATQETLINYLRGDSSNEANTGSKLYRSRPGPLGDIVHSQPVYVGKPSFNFADSGYVNFKADNVGRAATVYVGANDGMLHAFDAENGTERWAYVPPMVFPNLWRLADRDYASHHHYFVDGPIAVSDAAIGANGAWRTVLVGAMGAGGRGYYALDITDPVTPSLLWTFSAADDSDVGYTTGTPLIAKVGGQWVAILASGYNNVSDGDGLGHVFVRKLSDGSKVSDIKTTNGSTTDPSGLAALNVYIKSSLDYTALAAYGGDLKGTMFRFDLDKGKATVLMDGLQPITSAPEVTASGAYPMVFFGTGQYLGKTDLGTKTQQYIYGVVDKTDAAGATHKVSTSELANPTLSASGVISPAATPKEYGWYVALPNSGERVNIHPQLQLGAVLFATTIPDAVVDISTETNIGVIQQAVCNASGGYGFLYQFNFRTGGSPDSGNTQIGTRLDYLPVGFSLFGTGNLGGTQGADGKASIRSGSGRDKTIDIMKPTGSASSGKATRVQWRELLK